MCPKGVFPGPGRCSSATASPPREGGAFRLEGVCWEALWCGNFETLPTWPCRVTPQALEALTQDPDVAFVQGDFAGPGPSCERSPDPRPQAWEAGWSGAGQTVAILDCGVDKTCPLPCGEGGLRACYSTTDEVAGCRSVCPGGASNPIAGIRHAPSGRSTGERFYHGTHVAGSPPGGGGVFRRRPGRVIPSPCRSFLSIPPTPRTALTWEVRSDPGSGAGVSSAGRLSHRRRERQAWRAV